MVCSWEIFPLQMINGNPNLACWMVVDTPQVLTTVGYEV